MASVLIAPSLLACDFGQVKSEVERCRQAGADLLHLDFMDGQFVPNLSFGFPVTAAVASDFPDLPLDVHLMVENPDTYLERLAELKVSQVSVHWETCPHLHRTLQTIRGLGMRAGVAFNPHTPLQGLEHVHDLVDNIIIMTVNPGFGGQKFLASALPKVQQARQMVNTWGSKITICVDGGVNAQTGSQCVQAGADLLVAGSYLFRASNMKQALTALRPS